MSTEKLLLTLDNAVKIARLESENHELRRRVGKYEIIWKSDSMRSTMRQVDRVAAGASRVCILGETGTGKELVARALHEGSPRRAAPFVTLNCAAVPQELIESELFGHEKGSFTGAATRHIGRFEQAQGGTLFLDEIGDMPAMMQAKFLRVLEEGEIERVGGTKTVRVDVRVVVATHRNLEDLVTAGTFRQDLFHRIYVIPIVLPPLRDRAGDIEELAQHFAQRVCESNGWKERLFLFDAIEMLKRHHWPGNVRELRNCVERILMLSDGELNAENVAAYLPHMTPAVAATGTLASRVEAFERESILGELKRRSNSMTETARALGLERSHLYKKCAQLGIDLDGARKSPPRAGG
ncbi:MAG: sigma-54 dependent transcriptional regulator [Bryobacteraceae bacterium]